MKITRLYSGRDGESHFEEIEVPTERLQSGPGVIIRVSPPGEVQDWHPAPRRQYIVTLSGEVEVEIAGGIRRRFRAGDIMLADDISGHGHITRVIGSQPRVCAMIPIF